MSAARIIERAVLRWFYPHGRTENLRCPFTLNLQHECNAANDCFCFTDESGKRFFCSFEGLCQQVRARYLLANPFSRAAIVASSCERFSQDGRLPADVRSLLENPDEGNLVALAFSRECEREVDLQSRVDCYLEEGLGCAERNDVLYMTTLLLPGLDDFLQEHMEASRLSLSLSVYQAVEVVARRAAQKVANSGGLQDLPELECFYLLHTRLLFWHHVLRRHGAVVMP